MAKTKISQYDATAANNTDIDSINIAEGMAPSNVNNAIRELMAHLKDMDAGTQALTSPQLTSADINGGTIDGVTIGGASASAGTFTNLTATGTVTADGLTVNNSTVGDLITVTGANGTDLRIGNHASANGGIYINSQAASDDLRFRTQGSDRMTITSSGSVGIGTSSPSAVLHLGGSSNQTIQVEGASNTAYYGTNGNRNDIFVNYDPTDGTIPNSGRSVAGIQLDGANGGSNLRFRTSGANNAASTERMRITSAGSVGIGTSSPSTLLDIESSTASGGMLELSNTGDTSRMLFISTADGMIIRSNNSASGAVAKDTIFQQGTTERMRIDSSGNVGIGADSPASLLDVSSSGEVVGTIRSTSTSGARQATLRLNVASTGGDDPAGKVQFTYGTGYSVAGSIEMSHTSPAMKFLTGTTERMRITSSGNIGVSNDNAQIYWGAGTTAIDASSSDNRIRFYTNNSEAMRIDASGNLLVGTTSTTLTGNAGFTYQGGITTTSNNGSLSAIMNRNTNDGDIVQFRKDNVTFGSASSVLNGSDRNLDIGSGDTRLLFYGPTTPAYVPRKAGNSTSDGYADLGLSSNRFKDLYLSGGIEIENGTGNVGVGKQALNSNTTSINNTAVGHQAGYSNTTSSGRNAYFGHVAGLNSTGSYNTFIGAGAGNQMTTGTKNTILGRYNGNQGGLDIRTSSNNIVLSDGNGNPRLYINSDGRAMIGTSSTSGASTDDGTVLFENGVIYLRRTGTSTETQMLFSRNGSTAGTIQSTSTSVSYNTSSDYRLKENVVELTGATTRLKQLEPKRFNFIADADTTVDGFLAHEVQSIVPEAITGTHNEVDDDGNPVYQGIDQSKLVPLLVATIKELEARITALENA